MKWAEDECKKTRQLSVGRMVKNTIFPWLCRGICDIWHYDGIGSRQLNQTPFPKAKLVIDKVPLYYRHLLSKYQRNTEWKCHHKNFNVDFCIQHLQTVQRMLKFTSIYLWLQISKTASVINNHTVDLQVCIQERTHTM